MAKKKEQIDPEKAPGGITMERPEVEVNPPGQDIVQPEAEVEAPGITREQIEAKEVEEPERLAKIGKVPLHPAVVRIPFSVMGRIGTELTSYPGFTFTEQELADLGELWQQTGIMMAPLTQAAIGTTAMVGAKVMGYTLWVKAGKPKIGGEGEPESRSV